MLSFHLSDEIEEPQQTNDPSTVTHPLDVLVGDHFHLKYVCSDADVLQCQYLKQYSLSV